MGNPPCWICPGVRGGVGGVPGDLGICHPCMETSLAYPHLLPSWHHAKVPSRHSFNDMQMETKKCIQQGHFACSALSSTMYCIMWALWCHANLAQYNLHQCLQCKRNNDFWPQAAHSKYCKQPWPEKRIICWPYHIVMYVHRLSVHYTSLWWSQRIRVCVFGHQMCCVHYHI